MRTMKVGLDGASFTIAPLTLREYEEFIEKQKALLELPDGPAKSGQFRKIWREFMAMGLNNVLRGEDGKFPTPCPTKVEPDEIPDRVDIVMFAHLRDAMLKFNGLSSEPEEKKIPEVAATAAS